MSETTTNPTLMRSLEAAKNATEKAIQDMAAEHGRLHAEYKALGQRIGMLWALPLPRAMQLELLLEGVDRQAGKVPVGLGWQKLFRGFLEPTGTRKQGQADLPAPPERHPLRLADLQVFESGNARPLVALERILVNENDPMGSMRPQGSMPAGWGAQQTGGKPSFLGLFDGGFDHVITQDEATALLCFFVGDAVKAKLRQWFDATVSQDWPARPAGVSDADWALTLEGRREAIHLGNRQREELRAQMRELDQQIYKLAPGHDLARAAQARMQSRDETY